MSARRRPAAHAAGAVVTFLVVGVAAVVGVVWFLGAQAPVRITQGCTAVLDGREHGLSTVEAGNAALITGISVQRGLPARAATIGLATAMQESRLVNIDYGDRDSLGLFQQRPSQGWGTPAEIMDPVYSTNAFYDGLVKVDGWQDMEVTDAAQAVQRFRVPRGVRPARAPRPRVGVRPHRQLPRRDHLHPAARRRRRPRRGVSRHGAHRPPHA